MASYTWLDGAIELSCPPALGRELQRLFPPLPFAPGPCAVPGMTPSSLHLSVEREPRTPGAYALRRHGALALRVPADNPIPALEWAFTQVLVEVFAADHLLLHAAAVARDGLGIVFPAESGSGKTTLTIALINEGYRFFSDDVAAIRLRDGGLIPFPRSHHVEDGSCTVLSRHYPRALRGLRRYGAGPLRSAYLPPASASWPAQMARPRLVLFPRYSAGARTCLRPLARADALAGLLPHGFNLSDLGARGVAASARLLQYAACYTLQIGDLRAAVRLLNDLIATNESRRESHPLGAIGDRC